MALAMGMYAPMAAGRDRTLEFLAIADRLRKSSATSAQQSAYGSLPSANGTSGGVYAAGEGETARLFSASSLSQVQASSSGSSAASEFNKRASQIGLSIHQTSQKLSKLAKLAKRTSMFDDPAVEIHELTSVIRQDITALNSAVSDLQVLCDSRNDGANRTKQSSEHSSTVVKTLKNRLMDATKEFKDVLTLRTENLKGYENRRQLFTVSPANGQSNAFARKGPLASVAPSNSIASSVAPAPWGNGSTTSSELFSSRRRHISDGSDILHIQGQQQLQQRVFVQDSYMQNRAEALQNVESTITELSSIFTQLSTMVAQQGELAIRIDENMDDSLSNVEGAQGQLLKYYNSISSNRWLMLKIFMVLITFLLLFVFFIA